MLLVQSPYCPPLLVHAALFFFSPLPLKGELDLNSGAWSSFSFKTIVGNKVEGKMCYKLKAKLDTEKTSMKEKKEEAHKGIKISQ